MDKYDYDIDVDAFVIRKSDFHYAYFIDVTSEIILDVDSNQNLIGIEFLDASEILDVKPELLVHPNKIFAEVITTDEGIVLSMTFELDSLIRKFDTPISNLISSTNALMVDA